MMQTSTSTSRLSKHLRVVPPIPPAMTSSLKQQLYDIFQSLVKERDQLRLEVAQAHETINLLETEINAIKSCGDGAFAKVAHIREVSRHTFELVDESTSGSHWLKDIWLSEPNNAVLLGEAESSWRENMTNPQKALNIVGQLLKRTTEKSERIKCSLFMSAIMLAKGKTEESCAGVNDVLHQCGNDFEYKHLAGVAHYLRGRVFIEIKSFRQAYWDFSMAVFTPGYHERVKHFQQYAENRILQEDDQEQLSTSDGCDDQLSIDLPPNQRPALKLAPGMQVSLDEFEFEKASATPNSA